MKQAKGRTARVVAACAACLYVSAAVVAIAQAASKHVAAYTTKGAYSFLSAPQLHPPKLTPNGKPNYRALASGDFLITNTKNGAYTRPMVGEGGPIIYDSHLNPVWVAPVGTDQFAANLKLQSYAGKPALSWWQGLTTKTGQTSKGEVVLVDNQYKKLATVTGSSGWVISLHDAVLTGNDMWVTSYRNVPNQNLKPYGGSSSQTLFDSAVQEYELDPVTGSSVKVGKLINTWDAQGHIPLSDSYQKPIGTGAWDAYHVNSIQLVSSTQMLVSMRNTWAAYLIDIPTGKIVWTLGGKHSSFKPATPYRFQHDVELHRNGVVSAFDDACCLQTSATKFALGQPSRGLVLKIDTVKHTVKQLAQYKRSKFAATFLGNTQLLGNGNVLVGFGGQPFFTEFSKKGKILMDVPFPIPDESYRAYVQKWSATPFYPPSGALRKGKTGVTVYASWNGATGVSSWRVLAGASSKHLSSVAKASKSGFETTISLTKSYKVYELQALDSKGHVIGTSVAFPSAGHPNGTPGSGFYS